MHGWLWLLAQAVAAIIMIIALWRLALPALGRLTEPALLLDVWLPVTLVAPLLTFSLLAIHRDHAGQDAGATDAVAGSVVGIGWVSLGGPILLAALIVGAALIQSNRHANLEPSEETVRKAASNVAPWILRDWRPRAALAAVLAGLVILLLGAAHVLTMWIGNCAFALAAVLLWINTPDESDDVAPGEVNNPELQRMGFGMVAAVFAAIGQAVMVVPAGEVEPVSSMTIATVSAVVAGVLVVRAAGDANAIRVGLWTGGLGILFALGVLSLGVLLPRAILAIRLDADPGPPVVAHGFGVYAFEAVILIALPAAMLVLRMHRSQRMCCGIGLLGVTGLVAAWRVLTLLMGGF